MFRISSIGCRLGDWFSKVSIGMKKKAGMSLVFFDGGLSSTTLIKEFFQ